MPIEMLAILGKDHKVKKSFKNLAKAKETNLMLEKIYCLKGQKIKINGNKIKISLKKISKKHLKTIFLSQAAVVSVAAITFVVLFIVANTVGLGTGFSPRKVYSFEQLAKYQNKSKISLILENDIDITDQLSWKNYSGTLNGNNKTITFDYICDDFLFDKLTGTIKNLNIKYNEIEKNIEKNTSLLANKNLGKIENVNIECTGNFTVSDEAYICGFAITNDGYIHNSNIKFIADVESTTTSDVYICGIVGSNNHTISNCEILENSRFITKNVDASGIAIKNMKGAVISNCKNNAEISQTTDLENWSPNVAGIVLTNSGRISHCSNFGNLTIINNTTNQSNTHMNYLGGICAINFFEIKNSKNKCDIKMETNDAESYVGGICGFAISNPQSVEISFCGSETNFDITKTNDETFLFCGGISGFLSGQFVYNELNYMYQFVNSILTDCYSICTFSNEYNQETKTLYSLMVSSTRGDQSTFYIYVENIHCLTTENTEKNLAIIYTNFGFIYVNDINANITTHSSRNAIESCDIYW